MQAEEAKEPMPGAGLCPGYTISRAILSDAVALTRGDRFMTVDFTRMQLSPSHYYPAFFKKQYSIAHNLTSWGYDDCQANKLDGSYGGMLSKLLFRHLPANYPSGSAYAHFPFLVPKRMKEFAKKLPDDLELKYDWCRPNVPACPPIVARRYSEVKELLAGSAFTSGVEKRLEVLTLGVQLNTAPVGPP